MSRNWDFSGWATKSNIKCSDGRTILPNAFSGCDGMTVPLVWNHQHNDPSEVLGHALLENRGDGVYAYCSFNNNAKGREAKELVRHGDIKALSIYANQLVQSSRVPPCDVIHGMIREVSLVLAGANIGAFIDNVLEHGETNYDEAEIFHGDYDEDMIIYHADEDDDEEEDMSSGKSAKEVLDDLTPEQKAAVGVLLDQVMSHADDDDDKPEVDEEYEDDEEPEEEDDETEEEDDEEEDEEEDDDDDDDEARHSEDLELVADAIIHAAITGEEPDEYVSSIVENLNYDQQMFIGDVLNETAQHALDDEEYLAHSFDEYEDDEMKYNVFENYDNAPAITHADEMTVIELAKQTGSLKRAVEMSVEEGGVLSHAITDHNGDSITYGVANIDYLFPDARAINDTPEFINKPEDWVDKVINGTHHTPFSRVKSLFADLSGEDARALGYVKGKLKKEEVIEALKRETFPQTIYKKQKLDRDDILDITSFDVVAWLKAEMQIMLKAEIARAILIGDGRAAGDDKIKENNVRPIYNDSDIYTVKVPVNVANGATDNVKAQAIIDAVITSRRDYKGSGNPSFFISEEFLGMMLTLKDGMGHYMYATEAALASALRVKELIPVDVMDNQQIAIPTGVGSQTANKPLIGIIVNLQDYNVGADKGGATSFFDDFDIDYNQYKYLYETRMSGALIKPFSAMSVYMNEAAA